ncbi:MAG: hypothetical protein R3F59_17295 [Myxococcota bacterium]
MASSPYRIMLTPAPAALSRELVRGHLYTTVAARDAEGDYAPITEAEIGLSPLSRDELFELALSDLRRSAMRADLRAVDTLPGLYLYVARDGLAASRMALLEDLIDTSGLGGAVVAVPSPEQLLCVPLDSAHALDTLQVLASALGHALDTVDEPLSDQLFWFDGTKWIPLAVIHGEEEVTVLPTPAFVRTMNRLAAMDLVRVAGEA